MTRERVREREMKGAEVTRGRDGGEVQNDDEDCESGMTMKMVRVQW